MAPTESCEPCRFAVNCWRRLCPFTHPGNGRSKKWAAVWSLLAEQEEVLHSPPNVTNAAPAPVIEYAEPAVTDTASASADVFVAPAPAASYAAPAPVIVYVEPAVTDTAPAPAVEYVAPASVTDTAPIPPRDNVAPAPAVTPGIRAPAIEPMAPVPAVTDTAPTPAHENVAPAPAVISSVRAWLIEHAAAPAISFAAPPVIGRAASERAATDTAPAPACEHVAPAPAKKFWPPAPASQRTC